MIKVIDPNIGETTYDGACGSAGFLCEAFDYLKAKAGDKLTTKEAKTLQEETCYGQEKKSLAYVIGVMNMTLHGIDEHDGYPACRWLSESHAGGVLARYFDPPHRQ